MSELSREEAALACALHAMGWHQHYTNCVEQAKLTIRNAPESIRSALSGGGGGEKAETYWHGRFREEERDRLVLKDRCASLESRLAAAEKRAEEAERSAQVWKDCNETAERERDAALARVKELEADLELSESHRSTVQGRLASIARLAEGAQP